MRFEGFILATCTTKTEDGNGISCCKVCDLDKFKECAVDTCMKRDEDLFNGKSRTFYKIVGTYNRVDWNKIL